MLQKEGDRPTDAVPLSSTWVGGTDLMTTRVGASNTVTGSGDQPEISYLDTGPRSRTAVVLLHSLGADHRMWRHQLESLGAAHRVIAPDCRGHGASAGGYEHSVDAWTDDLRRVVDAAGVDRIALVGLSLGGIQAIAFAAAYPGRTAALVVADSFVELDDVAAQAKIASLSEQARDLGMAATADCYVADTFTAPTLPPGAEDVRKAIAGMDVDEYVASVKACFEVRIADRLERVTAPTLVMWGDRDTKTPRVLSEAICAGITGAELVDVPDAGHLSSIDNPEGFSRLTERFLERSLGPKVHDDMEGSG